MYKVYLHQTLVNKTGDEFSVGCMVDVPFVPTLDARLKAGGLIFPSQRNGKVRENELVYDVGRKEFMWEHTIEELDLATPQFNLLRDKYEKNNWDLRGGNIAGKAL